LPIDSDVSNRGKQRYPFSVVRERLRSHTGSFLDFAFGRHHVPPPTAITDFVRQQSESAFIRCRPDETDALIHAAAALFSRLYGIRPAPASILPAPGGRMAMSALGAALLEHGDTVLVTEPTYPVFARIASQLHAEVLAARLDPDRDFAPDLECFAKERSGPVRIVALNYPNNPTGSLLSPAARAELGRKLGSETVWFNDATYAPLTHDGPSFSLFSAGESPAEGCRAVELHSLVKVFALGPLSTAFLVGDETVVARVREYSEFVWAPMSSLQARVARLCLEDAQHIETVRDATRERLVRLREVLEALGFEVFPARAGMYLLCPVPSAIGGRSVEDAAEAAELLLAEHGVAVMPWETPPHCYLRFSGMYLADELEALRQLGGGARLVQP
jgi:aspartate/methionine/tyrosine aminotransferase